MTAPCRAIERVAILWPGDPSEPTPDPESTRLRHIFAEFAGYNVEPVPVVYADKVAASIREQLLGMHGALVWINPIEQGRDRTVLDAMLRDVASEGIFVSAHPDTILRMGTKDVLYATRTMPWGTDTRLYKTLDDLAEVLPSLLLSGPRVLKQHRGNGGNGVWKVEQRSLTFPMVYVQHALGGSEVEEISLDQLLERFAPYFAHGGCMVDQPYQSRLAEGMIRCYLVADRVVGFGHQLVTALLPPPPGASAPPAPQPRLYYGPSKPEFQRIKQLLEVEWIPQMEQLLGLERAALPMIWDADFLLGPKDPAGEDTYVLCEINVSCVFPVPDEAIAPLVRETVSRVTAGTMEQADVDG